MTFFPLFFSLGPGSLARDALIMIPRRPYLYSSETGGIEEEEEEEASFPLVSFIFSFPSSLLLLRRVGIVFSVAPSISVSPSLSNPPNVGRLKGSSILTYYGGEGGEGAATRCLETTPWFDIPTVL